MVLIKQPTETNCDYCGGESATIAMIGYGDDKKGDCHWCTNCALRLIRRVAEDLCEIITGDRSGDHSG
jgi:hypothetical protein